MRGWGGRGLGRVDGVVQVGEDSGHKQSRGNGNQNKESPLIKDLLTMCLELLGSFIHIGNGTQEFPEGGNTRHGGYEYTECGVETKLTSKVSKLGN